ncbi:MAG: hypothetical protein OXP09_14315 [Gammaproteobacteria bacterium]|nr:hypothetical protein [Gammaproteobacteria bacterium]MDE0366737.1 hypothetical protein [Gammaproteobacteria bacterium]
MKVVSELADIEFQVGAIARRGDELIIESTPDSTLAARVFVSPKDARTAIRRLLASPSAWGFLLRLPFTPLRARQENTGHRAWEDRRRSVGLNKPW